MPRFNPRNNTPAVPEDKFDFQDDFDDDVDDIADINDAADTDGFGGFFPDAQSYAEDGEEEWEKYLERMDPDGGGRDGSKALERRPQNDRSGDDTLSSREGGQPDGSDSKGKKKGRGGLIALVLLLLVAGVGAYLWFFTDLYYVAAVELNRTRMDLFVGEGAELEHKLTVFGSGTPDLEWSSSAPDVASVDDQGAINALASGEATVTLLEPESGITAQCTVSVHAVDEMVLGVQQITLGVGETYAMSVQTGAQGSELPSFVSSDSDVALVDESGTVTAVSVGTTDVTVSARGFGDASFSVTVMAAPTGISSSDAGGMCLGETRVIKAQLGEGEYCSRYSYQSDAPAVVSVDPNGLMTAVGKGSANITLTAFNGVSCVLPVTVGDEAGEITMPKELTAYNGLPAALGAVDSTGNCRQFFYTSSDPEIVQVDEQGVLSVLRNGEVTVTCTSYNGSTAKCAVTAKIVDYTTPYTSERVRANISALADSYPELISVESIGTSVQGRDITLLKLGTGERKVLIVAGMHSREGIAVTFTMRCIEEYAKAADAGDRYGRYDVEELLEAYTIYFVPLLNPDGMDIFMGLAQPEYIDEPLSVEELEEFKNNANGVNLNRNFPFEWGHERVNVTDPDGRSYAGASAGSEPETQAIVQLCAENEFEWLLDMHCKGHLIYYQDKVTGIVGNSSELARRLHLSCGFTLTDQSTRYEISGGLENWFRKEYDKPGICVELVESKYHPGVNKFFENKVNWLITKTAFLMCLED